MNYVEININYWKTLSVSYYVYEINWRDPQSTKAGKPTTPKEIADFLKEDVQTVRNILERLRKKGLVISSLAFGLGGFAEMSTPLHVSASERIYTLVDDIGNILQQHPEILDWAKVSLGIKDKNELIEYTNKRAKEIRLKSTIFQKDPVKKLGE